MASTSIAAMNCFKSVNSKDKNNKKGITGMKRRSLSRVIELFLLIE